MSELLNEILIELKHARTFITSREKMHPVGVEQYDQCIARVTEELNRSTPEPAPYRFENGAAFKGGQPDAKRVAKLENVIGRRLDAKETMREGKLEPHSGYWSETFDRIDLEMRDLVYPPDFSVKSGYVFGDGQPAAGQANKAERKICQTCINEACIAGPCKTCDFGSNYQSRDKTQPQPEQSGLIQHLETIEKRSEDWPEWMKRPERGDYSTWESQAKYIVAVYDKSKAEHSSFGEACSGASAIGLLREKLAERGEAEPVAYRYRDANGRWKYLNFPFTKGWDFPKHMKHEQLYTHPERRAAVPAVSYEQIAALLKGIDEVAAPKLGSEGWWEKHEGADYGAEILQQIKRLFEQAPDSAVAVPAEVREALMPFAREAEYWNDMPGVKIGDSVELWQMPSRRTCLTVGDLRRARAVLAALSPDDAGGERG
jgi:hypothetical protein